MIYNGVAYHLDRPSKSMLHFIWENDQYFQLFEISFTDSKTVFGSTNKWWKCLSEDICPCVEIVRWITAFTLEIFATMN